MDDFEEFVAGRSLALTRFAFLLSGDRHLAEDLVQEVLARMHRRWARVIVGGQPDAYIRGAIVRELLSWRRRRSPVRRPGPRHCRPSGFPSRLCGSPEDIADDRIGSE